MSKSIYISPQQYLINRSLFQEECLIWNRSTTTGGYGQIGKNTPLYRDIKETRAHRASYIIFNGPIPKGLNVCHKCDNPRCINPNHLFLGTQKDNMKDMYNKNRNPDFKGSNNPASKLTEKEVKEIKRAEYILPANRIAKAYDVSENLVSKIWNKKIWGHL